MASDCFALRDFYVDGLYYNKLSSTTVELGPGWYSNRYTGDINIPSIITYDNRTYTVVAIGYEAFLFSDSVKSVKLPPTITEIKDDAFLGCDLLTRIDLPDKVTKLGNSAFSGCHKLSHIKLPDGLISIGDGCFVSCENITEINIPEGLQHFGESVFGSCIKLSSIHLPKTIDWIPNGTFENCTSLDSIAIPDNVRMIGRRAFGSCKFTSLNLPDSLETIDEQAFIYCDKLTSITLPPKVKVIAKETFKHCSELTTLNLPQTLDRICESAFEDCVSLKSQIIPNSVSYIGENAFAGCTAMEEFTFGKGLKETNVCFGSNRLSLKKITSLNPTPPYVESWTTFVFCLFNTPLYVPTGSVESYQTANGWKEFYSINEISSDDSEIKDIQKASSRDAFRMEGRKLIAYTQISISVWSLTGERILSANLNENESVELPGGFQILRCDNTTTKISVPD